MVNDDLFEGVALEGLPGYARHTGSSGLWLVRLGGVGAGRSQGLNGVVGTSGDVWAIN